MAQVYRTWALEKGSHAAETANLIGQPSLDSERASLGRYIIQLCEYLGKYLCKYLGTVSRRVVFNGLSLLPFTQLISCLRISIVVTSNALTDVTICEWLLADGLSSADPSDTPQPGTTINDRSSWILKSIDGLRVDIRLDRPSS